MFNVIIEKLEEIVDFCSAKWHMLTNNKRGEDDFSGFLWIVGIILLIIDLFLKKVNLLILGIVLVIYGIFRCFSTLAYHERENAAFQSAIHVIRGMIKTFWNFLKRKFQTFQQADKKEMMEEIKEKVLPDEETKLERAEQKALKDAYYIFECPGCKKKVRIPNRGKKGRVAIVCPACQTRFVKMRW